MSVRRRPFKTLMKLCSALRACALTTLAAACLAGTAALAQPAAPAHTLTRDLLSQILTAELALERGNAEAAWRAYWAAANQSGYAELAQKALEAAQALEDDKAVEKATRLLNKLDPDNRHILLKKAREDFEAGRFKEAAERAAAALAQVEDPVPDLEDLASLVDRVDEKTRFYEAFVTLTKSYKDEPSVELLCAHVAAAAKMREKARDHAVRAFEAAPDNPHVLLRAADFEFQIDPKRAAERLEAFAAEHPSVIEVRLALARALLKAGERDKLQHVLAQLEKDHRNSARVMFVLGMFAEESGLLTKAESHYKRYLVLVAKDPKSGMTADGAYVRLGMVMLAQRRTEEAITWLHKVQSGDKYHAARLKEAELLTGLDRVDEACRVLKTMRADSDAQKAGFVKQCAQILMRKDRKADALDALVEVTALAPEDTDLLYQTAMLAVQLERIQTAEKLLTDYIARQPEDANGYNALGYMWLSRGLETERAAEMIERAMKLSDGKDAYIVDSMGWLRYTQKRLDEAETLLRRAQNANPGDAEIALHLAEVLIVRGKAQEARGHLESVLEGEPDNAKAKALLQQISPTQH